MRKATLLEHYKEAKYHAVSFSMAQLKEKKELSQQITKLVQAEIRRRRRWEFLYLV